MRLLNVVSGIDYGLLESADAPRMASLLADAFSRFEPMAVAVKLPYAQVERLVAAFVPKAISEQLAIVARDPSRGRLVGALLADDFGTAPPTGLEEAAPLFAPVGALLDGLDEQYRATTSVAPGTHVHIFMVGVDEKAGSRGIAGHLVGACIAQAQRLGYQTAVTEATGAASQHVFRKARFQGVATARYRDFAYGGQHVFSAITGVEGTMLMTLDLQGHPPSPGSSGAA